MDRGLHLYPHGNLLIVAPPLIIAEEELREGLVLLDGVLAVADELAGA